MNHETYAPENINIQPLQGPGLETGHTEGNALARSLVIGKMTKALLDKSNELWARHDLEGLPEDFVPPSNQGPVRAEGKWRPKLAPGETWNAGDATPYDTTGIGGKGQRSLPKE